MRKKWEWENLVSLFNLKMDCNIQVVMLQTWPLFPTCSLEFVHLFKSHILQLSGNTLFDCRLEFRFSLEKIIVLPIVSDQTWHLLRQKNYRRHFHQPFALIYLKYEIISVAIKKDNNLITWSDVGNNNSLATLVRKLLSIVQINKFCDCSTEDPTNSGHFRT